MLGGLGVPRGLSWPFPPPPSTPPPPPPPGGLFLQGWKPFPTVTSARGGGVFVLILLHCAASMARGVPPNDGCSCKQQMNATVVVGQIIQTNLVAAGT